MSLLTHLSDIVGQAFSDLGLPTELGAVVPSQRRELAQFQSNGAMAGAKLEARPPREIAQDVIDGIATHEEFKTVHIDVDGSGSALVSDGVWDWILSAGETGFRVVGHTATPPTLQIGGPPRVEQNFESRRYRPLTLAATGPSIRTGDV